MATSGFSPSYSWTGPPTQFNGTNPLIGGDSCTFSLSYRAITLSSNVSGADLRTAILAMTWLTMLVS